MKLAARFLCLSLLVFFFAGLEGCAGTAGSGKRLLNAELRILSFGSVNGELAPCG